MKLTPAQQLELELDQEFIEHFKGYNKYDLARAYQEQVVKNSNLEHRFSQLQKENANLRYQLKLNQKEIHAE